VTPAAKRQAITILHETHGLSVQRSCQVVRLSRTAYYRPPGDGTQLVRDQPVIDALPALVEEHTRWGFWKCYDRFSWECRGWNHKRVDRVYCAVRLNLPRRTRRRVPRRIRTPLLAPASLNTTWAIDFMLDRLYDGRRFRTFNVIDESNREGLAIEVGTAIPALRVIAVLEELIALHGAPRAIRCDNGPELTSLALTAWCKHRAIALRYIQPGKPSQNAFIERFNRTYRTEILDAYVFASVTEVRELTTDWLDRYNTQRPHDSPVTCRRSPIDRDRPRSRSLFSNCDLDGGAYHCMRRDTSRETRGNSVGYDGSRYGCRRAIRRSAHQP
jgi:putative transposase